MRKKELRERLEDREATIRAYYRVNANLRDELLRLVAENGRLLDKLEQVRAAIAMED